MDAVLGVSAMEYNVENCQRCPDCGKRPTVTMESRVLGMPGDDFVLRCEQHGHVSSGQDFESAAKHWNRYIEFVLGRVA